MIIELSLLRSPSTPTPSDMQIDLYEFKEGHYIGYYLRRTVEESIDCLKINEKPLELSHDVSKKL